MSRFGCAVGFIAIACLYCASTAIAQNATIASPETELQEEGEINARDFFSRSDPRKRFGKFKSTDIHFFGLALGMNHPEVTKVLAQYGIVVPPSPKKKNDHFSFYLLDSIKPYPITDNLSMPVEAAYLVFDKQNRLYYFAIYTPLFDVTKDAEAEKKLSEIYAHLVKSIISERGPQSVMFQNLDPSFIQRDGTGLFKCFHAKQSQLASIPVPASQTSANTPTPQNTQTVDRSMVALEYMDIIYGIRAKRKEVVNQPAAPQIGCSMRSNWIIQSDNIVADFMVIAKGHSETTGRVTVEVNQAHGPNLSQREFLKEVLN